jgi:hypothetical protein
MPRNGSGTYSAPAGTSATANTLAESAKFNELMTDIGSEITASLPVAGTKAMAANLPMGSNRITSLAPGTALTDGANAQQVQERIVGWADSSGTDTITATYSPAITAYTNGMTLGFRSAGANTSSAPTFNANSVGAKKIFKAAGAALVAGDIAGDHHDCLITYNSALDTAAGGWLLHNPQSTQEVNITGQTALTAIAVDDEMLIYDLSATANKKITLTNVFDIIDAFTADGTPDANADYVATWDASASSVKKVLLKNLRPLEFWEYAIGDESTAVTTGTAKITVRAPKALTVTDVRASATAAGAGAITIDINESGTTILSTKLTMDASEKTSTTAATPAVVSDTAIANDAEITFDIDAVSGTWAGVKVRIYGYPA